MIEPDTVTLVCSVCLQRQDVSTNTMVNGRPILVAWYEDRHERCRKCAPTLPPVSVNAVKLAARATATSRAASLAVLPRSGSQRAMVLNAINSCPATDEELSDALKLDLNSIRPRRLELVEGGWIEDSGFTRKTAMKNDAIVWQLTQRAIYELAVV